MEPPGPVKAGNGLALPIPFMLWQTCKLFLKSQCLTHFASNLYFFLKHKHLKYSMIINETIFLEP
jgi:hypothetical protein